MRDSDQQFFDSFMLVVGILIGFTVAIFFLVQRISSDTQGTYVLSDPTVVAEIDARIAPVGNVVLAGSEELAAASVAPVSTPEPVATVMTGPQVYNAACIVCHAPPGLAGAPALGDAAVWEARVEKGMDVLSSNAINGFTGSTGTMPAKGGRVDLSDEEIIAAIEYMLEQLDQ